MTNEENIKSMTTEELAEWLFEHVDCLGCPICDGCVVTENDDCRNHFREWLEKEARKN